MALGQLDGPRMPPASGGKAKQLVILCHGYGSDGNDLIGLAPHWQRLLPDAAFVSPNAPERCEMSPMGYQWFGIGSFNEAERLAGARRAAPVLDAFIDAELARHGLADENLALVGFSQGTLMSLHVGLRRERPPAAIVGYSGALAGADQLADEIVSRPPVLLVHGDRDEMIPVAALHKATGLLGAAGVPVQWHVSPGLGHSIDPMGLKLGGEFIQAGFAGRLPAGG
jgi:phospholipase/carboxylesterase